MSIGGKNSLQLDLRRLLRVTPLAPPFVSVRRRFVASAPADIKMTQVEEMKKKAGIANRVAQTEAVIASSLPAAGEPLSRAEKCFPFLKGKGRRRLIFSFIWVLRHR